MFDYSYYQRFTVVPWNIISYNVFGGKERGPSLYGTEPWNYYFINGFLNFNLIFIVAIISLPGLVSCVLKEYFNKYILFYNLCDEIGRHARLKISSDKGPGSNPGTGILMLILNTNIHVYLFILIQLFYININIIYK